MKFSDRAEAVMYRSYCRPKSDASDTLLESWEDVCERSVITHHTRLWENAGGKVDMAELEELKQFQLRRQATLAGRTLWMGGTPYGVDRPCSNFNCAFLRIDSVYAVVDAFWLLLNGSGVGFQPVPGTLHGFQRRIPQIEVIPSTLSKSDRGDPHNSEIAASSANGFTRTITIGDSAEAWAKAVGKLLNPPTHRVERLVLDFSRIRGKGERLKGYGWICNGWEPLRDTILRICDILNNKAGELLDAIDILDIVNHLGTVLSSRRSAEIGLLPAYSEHAHAFATAKQGCWVPEKKHRQQSNNSLVWYRRPSYQELRDMLQLIADCGGSEPGFVNGEAALRRAPWFAGMNPSLRAGTRVLTATGIVPIETLENSEFQSPNLNGEWSKAKCWLSGRDKPLYRLTLATGLDVYATAEHKWPVYLNGRYVKVQTSELKPGDELPLNERDTLPEGTVGTHEDGFVVGYLLGNGSLTVRKDGRTQVGVTVPTLPAAAECLAILQAFFQRHGGAVSFHPSSNGGESVETSCSCNSVILKLQELDFAKGRLPKWCWSGGTEAFRRGVIAGYHCADGSVDTHGSVARCGWNTVSEANYGLLREVAELCGFYGIRMHLRSRHATATTPNGNKYEGVVWSLRSGATRAVRHFWKVFRPEARQDHAAAFMAEAEAVRTRSRDTARVAVEAVELTELREDVWDVSVADETHCFTIAQCVTGNCAEILLANHGFCNLVSLACPLFGHDFAGMLRAAYLVARANYRQTAVNLRDGVLTNEWHQTNEALRLCGVSLTGLAMMPHITDYQLRQLKHAATYGAYSMADELDLPRPKLITTIKPEGSRSKISDVTEGIHKPLGRYIFNFVNFSDVDPIVDEAIRCGYEVMRNPHDKNNMMVRFPVDYGGCQFESVDGMEVNRESAVSQLERYKRFNAVWADHNVSNTISWDISERDAIAQWLYSNWDDYVAVSFVFRNDPTKTAKDLGYAYLPQQVAHTAEFQEYTSRLKPINWAKIGGIFECETTDCPGGQCPVR